MPVTIKYPNNPEKDRIEHVGRVLEIKVFDQTRNLSDTLDYSDWQTVECTYALVYRGRRGKNWPEREDRDLAVHERFVWDDCSNLFAWRGEPISTPELDVGPFDREMIEDYAAYLAYQEDLKARNEADRIAAEEAKREADARRERDRPVKGKRMRVKSGRKVPVNTVGVVAFVSDNGVLLKDPARWQDRRSDGVWVNPEHLESFEACLEHEDCKGCSELALACADSRMSSMISVATAIAQVNAKKRKKS